MERDFSTILTAAQKLKTCSQCEEGILYLCKTCSEGLCKDCVHHHVSRLGHVQHSIVLYRNKNSDMVFPSCDKHPSYKLDTFCRRCRVPLCLECWISCRKHDNHQFGYLKEFIDLKQREIISGMKYLENVIIPALKAQVISIGTKLKVESNKYGGAIKNAEASEYNILNEVQEIFSELKTRMQLNKEKSLSLLRNQTVYVEDALKTALKMVHRSSMIYSKDDSNLSEMFDFVKQIQETKSMLPDLHSGDLNRLHHPIIVNGKSLRLVQHVCNNAFENLSIETCQTSLKRTFSYHNSDLLNNAVLIRTINTGQKNILRFVYWDSTLWLCSLKSTICQLKLVSGNSSLSLCKEIMCPDMPQDITVSGDELFYSCWQEGIFRVKDGKSKMYLSIPNWNVEGLCGTRTNGLLVCMSNSELQEVKIVRFEPSLDIENIKLTQEIQYHEDKDHPLFQFGNERLFVAENKNGDICASDTNADAVIVVNRTGQFRFKYQGRKVIHKTLFKPDQIIKDSFCNIIVSDYFNNCLHILDQNGSYVNCVKECELDIPVPLDLDDDGNLLVGMYLSGQMKVIRYRNS
ncbi:uncharacterized protein LOC134233436 [Saccostrea cucullata]|uniref:uncharacterized protein LOC134233436 n=1 Tax=Saccostrea cuccullata TaxID=36930 RepID=UPI002ED481F3